MQLFWRAIRSRGHSISEIDALTEIQAVSFSHSMFRALQASWSVPLLSLLAASTSLLSIFAPGSIKVSQNHSHSQTCTVLAPRNLSELNTTQLADYVTPITTGMLSGTYLPPASPCPGLQCSYNLEFVGPGLDCQDVTQSSNYTAFNTSYSPGYPILPLYIGNNIDQTDLTMQINVQAWDVKRSRFQAVNCTGVSRSYAISISSGTTALSSTISVTESRLFSTVHANVSQLSTFTDTFLDTVMALLVERQIYVLPNGAYVFGLIISPGEVAAEDIYPFSSGSSIAHFELDGSFSIAENLTQALEEFAQNSTMSILSGTVFAFNSDDPNLLENITTTCTYQSTAYEYSPYRLFLTYGVAIFIAILCAIWGTIAVKRNGVKESMNFSRILQAVLNEKMFNVRNRLDEDTVLKADNTEEGSLEPSNPSLWH